MKTGLTAHIVLYNVNKVRYPWRQAIQSVLPVVAEVIAVECGSTDGTREELQQMASVMPIRILDGHWGDRSDVLSAMTNKAIAHVKTAYHFQIQADECLHENSYEALTAIPRMGMIDAASFRFVHLVGDFFHVFPFMYQRAIRFAKTTGAWHSVGDAAQFDSPASRKSVFPSKVQIWHYGKVSVGRRKQAAIKEFEFQQMFVHLGLGFPDPLVVKAHEQGEINYVDLFHVAAERGEIKPLTEQHPAIMQGWIEASYEREQAESNL